MPDIRWAAGLTLAGLLVHALTGGFSPTITPDTGVYLQLAPFPDFLAQQRTPLYAWLIAAGNFGHHGFIAVPALQLAIYVAAVWVLVAELRGFGLSMLAGMSTAASLLFANAALLTMRWVHPDPLSLSFGLIAFASVIRIARERVWWAFVLVALSAGFAYILAPRFLSFILVLPLMFALLCALRGERPAKRTIAAIAVAAALPFLMVSTLRAVTVGDFNIVSFGGYQLSGMAGLMLSDDVVAKLPDDVRPLAADVLAARKAAEEAGTVLRVPVNAAGERSFYSAAVFYFDLLARTYDAMLGVMLLQWQPGEPWVALNKRLMRFALAVLAAAPDRYLVWVIGGCVRLVGQALVLNVALLAALIALAIGWPARVLARRSVVAPRRPLDTPVMIVLALAWFVAAGLLSVTASFPASRYVMAAAMLLAPVAIYWAVLIAIAPAAEARGATN